ncbi:microcephalin isoform X2 [Rana temporaria]|uniref:microcephalin isoform X2 n=1 Tax=Rana temporaria TaxID=8407 RepID=UPI001AACB51C|nr:microcephalin isoform X2 [Rana temporaria]
MELAETLSPACGAGSVLTGVTAYVEVWSSSRTENYSQSFTEQLLNLGAKVTKRLNKQVTHVVFKDGSESTWDKAVKSGVKLVSVLWVDKCREAASHIDESLFPALNPNEGLPHIMKRKRKCMQPKDLVIKTPENDRRLARKFDKMLKELEVKKASLDVSTLSFDNEGLLYSPVAVIADRCNAMERRLQEMKKGRQNLSPTDSQMSQTVFDFSSPKLSPGNSPSISNDASHENYGNNLDTSFDELFGSLENIHRVPSNFKNQETNNVQEETNLHLDCINLFPLEAQTSTSSVGAVKKRNSGSCNQSRGRKSQVKLKVTDDNASGVFCETPTRKKKAPALDHILIKESRISNSDCKGQCTVSPYTESKGWKTYSPKAADKKTKDYETDAFCMSNHKKSETSSLDTLPTANRLSEISKSKVQTRRSNCLNLKSEVLSTKKNIIKDLSKSNLSPLNADPVARVSEYDDFFSSENPKSNRNNFGRFSLTLKPQKSPSPPPMASNKKGSSKRRRSTDLVSLEKLQAKKHKTINAFNHSNSSPIQSTVQEASNFPIVPEKKDDRSPKSLIMNAVESPSQKREISAKKKFQTNGNMDYESSPSNELKKDTDVAPSNGIKEEDVFKEGLNLENGLALEEHEKLKTNLQPNAESRTSGSEAIAGLSEMFNEQRNKCTEESRKTEKSRKVTRSLVMTSMSTEKQNTVIQVVKTLGGFIFSDNVCESTSHVVSGSARRTLNIILGIARGCWILSYDWEGFC